VSEAGPALYDPVELRRRIVVCFSVGELKALADSLGVGGIAWERGLHEAAREVVRQCERYAGLPSLVAKLREVRPLVEWPDAATTEPSATALSGAPPALLDAPAAPPTGLGFPALTSSPGSFGPAGAEAPALRDPYAPPPGPPAIHLPPAVAAVVAANAAVPPTRLPTGTAWPGVTGEPAAPARGVDPRIFLAVAGLMVLAAIIAYLAGRASTAAAPAGASPAPSVAATGAPRAEGPAALAADTLARSFANLARVCELPSSAGADALVFKRVFERCGPAPPPRRSYSPPVPITAADPATTPAASAEPAPTRGKRPGRGGDAAPGEAPPATKGCSGACDAQHSTCRARCGPEPIEGSAYDGYQHCLGRCLSDASRCKLTCH
jgi:hypothetical protein